MKLIDMKFDTIIGLLQQKKEQGDASLYHNSMHLDIQKMQKGEYLLQNFAVFTHLRKHNPLLHVQESIDLYYQELENNKEYIRPVYKYNDILENQKNGHMSAMLTLEEGAVIQDNLAMLRNYYRLGVRMITLTWNFKTSIAAPNFESHPDMTFKDLYTVNETDGLTEFGIEYVKEMEHLGIIIDVSHLSDAGFYDVLKHTTKPFVASHSNAREVCGVARNLTDDMIVALSKRGGVMGINYCGDFLLETEEGNAPSNIEDIVKHIQHIVSIGGIDCIGLGSDFDGIDSKLELQDASYLPQLEKALQKAGFTNEDIEKIFYKNVLRVYKEILI
ncbi:MAG: dipeptidase [Coprobacillaceae bacterium]